MAEVRCGICGVTQASVADINPNFGHHVYFEHVLSLSHCPCGTEIPYDDSRCYRSMSLYADHLQTCPWYREQSVLAAINGDLSA